MLKAYAEPGSAPPGEVVVGGKGHKALKELWLNSTKVTDAGLKELKGLGRLEFLELADTKVTETRVSF